MDSPCSTYYTICLIVLCSNVRAIVSFVVKEDLKRKFACKAPVDVFVDLELMKRI